MDPRQKAMLLAFMLWKDANAKQVDIARLLNVSEGTISLWLKEMKFSYSSYVSDPRYEQDVNEVRRRCDEMRGSIEKERPTYGF